MIAKVKARFSEGVLKPLEPLNIEDGAEVVVSVEETPVQDRGLGSIVGMIDRLRESYPPETWDGLPSDLAKSKKHYLYGHSKEEA